MLRVGYSSRTEGNVMWFDGNTMSNDGRTGTVFGMEITRIVVYSSRTEGKCNVTGIQRVMIDV